MCTSMLESQSLHRQQLFRDMHGPGADFLFQRVQARERTPTPRHRGLYQALKALAPRVEMER